jgi:hypothetical protein
MKDELISVHVQLSRRVSTILHLKPERYQRHVADAEAEGLTVEEYLAARIIPRRVSANQQDHGAVPASLWAW